MKKGLTVLLCALAAVMCFSACGKEEQGEVTTTVGDTSGTVETEATEEAVLPLNVVESGATEYKIVRPDETSEAIRTAAMTLHQAINKAYGTEMALTTDFEKRGFDTSTRYPYEIVVGSTNRDESAAAKELIRYNDSIIAVMGTRVVITGGSDEAVVTAVEHFIDNYLTADKLQLDWELRDVLPATYPKSEIKLGGVDISEYTIVYASSYKNAAYAMADRIGDACGARMKVAHENTEKSGREIVLGSTKRGAVMTGLAYDTFAVEAKGEDLVITGGAVTSVETGCAKLLDVLLADGVISVALADAAISYTLPDRQVYIDDISKLALNWELYFDTPAWMLDYEEKYAAMLDADGRLMSCLHRGDMQMYPENSIEGLISAIRMGGDMVEIDPRRTKDGVLILLHDETLTRTTDFSAKAGKNGLPTSAKVADWTYAQLQQLNLKTGAGGSNARVTEYKIPTLDEAFKVCANRIFIRLDVKADASGKIFWDYGNDIWPLMLKYKSYTNVIYTWHGFVTANGYALVKKYNAEQIKLCGRSAIHFSKGSGSATSVLATVQGNPSVFDPTVRLTDFDLSKTSYKTYLKNNADKLSGLNDRVRIYVDSHGTNADYPENTEGAALYEALNGAGINVLLVNKGYTLCTYIAEHFEATPK